VIEKEKEKLQKKEKVERRTVAVPASPLARVFGFGQLAAGLAAGTISESARRAWNGNGENNKNVNGGGLVDDSPLIGGGSVFMTEANAERLAVALCRMRGAALKLGQMLSIQDESFIPPQIQRALERVREGADTMPPAQLHKAIEDQLGGAAQVEST
jgi:aarF domain-containing kinase